MNALIQQLWRQLKLIASRGRLTAVNDGQGVQQVQVELLKDELRELTRLQDYGLTSVPLPGAQLISLSLSGERQQAVVIRCEDGRYRKTHLEPGEVCLYTDEGDLIHLRRGRKIDITAGAEVNVTAPEVTVTASTKVTLTSGASTIEATPAAISLDTTSLNLKASNIQMQAPAITMDGAVTVTGALTAAAVSDATSAMTDLRSVFNSHTHKGDSGGNTGTPNQEMT